MLKILYIVLGSLAVLLGALGIIIPGLPTTPFLLLAAWFFFRSNEKLYKLLINNKFLGKYICRYEKRKAISLKTKIYSIALMWLMISLSVVFLISSDVVRIVVVGVGLVGTIIMGFVIKTYRE